MEAITVATKPEELEAVYLEAKDTIKSVKDLNASLDAMDPLLDQLANELELNEIKARRVRGKMNKIMAKL